jgi:sortase A
MSVTAMSVSGARLGALLKAGSGGALMVGALCLVTAGWINVKAYAAQRLISAAWQRERGSLSADAAPWPWADTRPIAKLTWGEGRAAPTLMVLEGSSGRNLAFGPVHDPASVAPGSVGNSVIEGHRDTHFKILRGARPGDSFTVETVDGLVKRFVVTDVRVVDSGRARILLDADVPQLTLVTCYPFDAVNPGGPLRWVVTAEAASGARLL